MSEKRLLITGYRLLPAAATCLMDACWIYCVLWLVSRVVLASITYFPVPEPLLLALLELAGWRLTSALLRRGRLSDFALRALTVAVGIALALIVGFAYNPLPGTAFSVIYFLPLVYTFLAVLGVWMLGGFHASERATYERVYGQFRLGLVVIAVSVLLATLIARDSRIGRGRLRLRNRGLAWGSEMDAK